jgi:PAS domain S-box-containing protein
MPDSASADDLLSLRHAVEASREIIFLTDAGGTITFVNAEFTRVYGYTAEEVVGKTTPRVLKSGEVPLERYQSFWKTLVDDHMAKFDVVNRTKDGRLLTIEATASAVLNTRGIAGFVAIQRDVTERRKEEETLRLTQFALDHAADSVYFVQPDGGIAYVNEAAVRSSGYSREELLTMRVFELDSRLSPERLSDGMRELATAQLVTFESELRRKDGEVVPVEVAASHFAFGGREYACGVVRDLAERKQLQDELRQAQKMEAIGRLAGGIAHDFNNLLTAIFGYSELLRRRLRTDPELVAELDEITKAGERAATLTRQLLAVSRRQALQPRPVNLNAIVDDLEKMLRRVIGEDVQFRTALAPSLGTVRADPGQIEQVLLNLAVNARDAMPRGGSLSVETRDVVIDHEFTRRHAGAALGPYVCLTVSDDGCGMPADVLSHVFEPFFTTKAPGRGTGLGLSTVYGIVTQSGGYIAVESRPGAGTTFHIYLPRVDAPWEAKPGGVRTAPGSRGSETILLVEDDPGISRLVRRILERHGYTLLSCEDPFEAVRIAQTDPQRIDLLLSDVVMPGMSGVDVAQHVIACRRDIAVMFISGFSVHTHVGRLSPQVCFLQKPFTPDALLNAVYTCLQRRATGAQANG